MPVIVLNEGRAESPENTQGKDRYSCPDDHTARDDDDDAQSCWVDTPGDSCEIKRGTRYGEQEISWYFVSDTFWHKWKKVMPNAVFF